MAPVSRLQMPPATDERRRQGMPVGASEGELTLDRAVVLPGNELVVPAQDRVGRHQTGELLQRAANVG